MNIETANKKRGIISHIEEETEPEPEPAQEKPEDTPPLPKKNGLVKKLSQSGIPNVISKESLILVPEGGETILLNGHSNEKYSNQNGKAEPGINNNNEQNSDQQVINVSC